MKTKLIAGAIIVCGLVVALYAQQGSQRTAETHRYQLVGAQVEDKVSGQTTHVVFLLDTQTGQTFRYQSPFSKKDARSGEEAMVPDIFYPVEVRKSAR